MSDQIQYDGRLSDDERLRRVADLSPWARKIYDRMARGKSYPPYGSRIPKHLRELIDAGLVVGRGQAVVVQARYVREDMAPGRLFPAYFEPTLPREDFDGPPG